MEEKLSYWLAALIDGEGSIIRRNKNRVAGRFAYSIVVSNNSVALLERVKEICGAGKIYPAKRAFQLRIERAADVLRLLKCIAPILIIKGDKAREAISNLENQGEWKPKRDPLTGHYIDCR